MRVSCGYLLESRRPLTDALKETRKLQNVSSGVTLLDRVLVLQRAGLLIFGGFILGFDNETDDIFDRQIDFITAAAIPNAMVGQLGALPNTPLTCTDGSRRPTSAFADR